MEQVTVLVPGALERAPLRIEPYQHVCAAHVLRSELETRLLADAPAIRTPGSFPLGALRYGPTFAALIADLLGERFRAYVAERFMMDLERYPRMVTVRGYVGRNRDGYVHADSRHKTITVLLYLNPSWSAPGGRLRVLRSRNIDDYALEIPPEYGTMLIFRRCDHSWHGHLPYEGPRLSIQLNWVDSASYVRRENLRHGLSAFVKTFLPPLGRLFY